MKRSFDEVHKSETNEIEELKAKHAEEVKTLQEKMNKMQEKMNRMRNRIHRLGNEIDVLRDSVRSSCNHYSENLFSELCDSWGGNLFAECKNCGYKAPHKEMYECEGSGCENEYCGDCECFHLIREQTQENKKLCDHCRPYQSDED